MLRPKSLSGTYHNVRYLDKPHVQHKIQVATAVAVPTRPFIHEAWTSPWPRQENKCPKQVAGGQASMGLRDGGCVTAATFATALWRDPRTDWLIQIVSSKEN